MNNLQFINNIKNKNFDNKIIFMNTCTQKKIESKTNKDVSEF